MKATAALLAFATLAPAQNAIVEGTVSNSVTHAGVPGAKVTLYTQKGVRYNATADASGAFRITDVQPGDYNSRVESQGYVDSIQPRLGQQGLRVALGGNATRLDVQLDPMATLRGRVLDSDGNPAPKVSVGLGPFAQNQTDAEGRFVFKDVRPGTYTLRATVDQPPTKKASQEAARTEIVPTFFPSTANEAEAERIVVRAGADLAGYDIRLRKSLLFRVKGVVLDDAGKPAPGATVQLIGAGSDRLFMGQMQFGYGLRYFQNLYDIGTSEMPVKSGDDGAFEFPAVRPGDWRVQARLDPQHDAKNNLYVTATEAVPVSVSDRDVDHVELRFAPSFTLTVTLDWGGQQAPAIRGSPVLLIGAANLPVGLQPAAPDGTLRMEHVLPGRYRIVPIPGLPPGFYASAVMAGGQDVLGKEVELAAAMPEVRVVYKPNPGTVRGTVEDGEGATVLLWPEGVITPDLVRVAEAGPRGAFEMAGVPPGAYSVLAFDRINAQTASESFLRSVLPAGARVTISEGGVESVQIKVVRWPE